MMRIGFAAGALALSVSALAGAHAGFIDCAALEDRWEAAGEAPAAAELKEIYDKAWSESDCGPNVVKSMGLAVIERELSAVPGIDGSAGDGELRALLDRLDGLGHYGRHWRLSFLRGELSRRLRDPAGALHAYQDALLVVDDLDPGAAGPTREQVMLLRDRLDETSLIAAQIVAPSELDLPRSSSGALVSQYAFETFRFARVKVPVPIYFVFATDVMTEAGRVAFERSFEALKEQGSPDIVVVGHADPVGPAEYNRRLSLDRAEAVRSRLAERGYAGRIAADGRGEDEPFRFDDPGLYSIEHRHQAHRRVEFRLLRD